jgi:small ubiquitin-related modifier
MSDNGSPSNMQKPEDGGQSEHLNIKVTDNNNEVFFKIKRTTALKKLMDAFCDRQGKNPSSVRFLFDGTRVQPGDNPDSVRTAPLTAVPILAHPQPPI